MFSKVNTAPASGLKTIHHFLLLGVVSQSRQRRLCWWRFFWCDCFGGEFSCAIVLMDGPLVLARRGAPEAGDYRGTLLSRKRTLLGSYRRPVLGSLGSPRGVGVFLWARYPCNFIPKMACVWVQIVPRYIDRIWAVYYHTTCI